MSRPGNPGWRGRSRLWAGSMAIALCSLASGCASLARPPADLDLMRAAITMSAAEPVVSVDGPSGKGSGALRGAASGTGLGFIVGALSAASCAATGLMAGACIATVISTSTAIGTVGGAAVGAYRAENADAIELKRRVLGTGLTARSYPSVLAEQVQLQARERFSVELPLLADAGAVAASHGGALEWLIDLSLTNVAGNSSGPDQPFSLRVEGHMSLRHPGESKPVYESSYQAVTDASLTTAEWDADGSAAMQAGLNQSLRLLANKMLSDLVRSPGVERRDQHDPSQPAARAR